MPSDARARKDGGSRRGTRALPALGFLTVLLSGITACGPGGGGPDGGPDPDDGFPDRTVPRIDDVEAFDGLARAGPGSRSVKFVVTGFSTPGSEAIRYYDSTFYALHDEWYWFRLLNGARIPGLQPPLLPSETPVEGLSFDSIDEIYAWAKTQPTLPLDLRFVGERLYSPRFYELALFGATRAFGAGTLLRFDARTAPVERPEIWAFELEFQDAPSHATLVRYFRALEETLPAQVATSVRWLVRSAQQEALAATMEAEGLAYADRVLRYAELTVPGEVEVYSEGLVAGRLKIVRRGEGGLEDARATDILVVEDVPDFLPQCSGLLSAVPQTPLAHVNVLAKNRGIPNAYVAGILEDPNLDQLARVSAPVVVRAKAPGTFELVPMTESEFATWRQLTAAQPSAVQQVDVEALPPTIDLEAHHFSEADELRPRIGGKSTGFLALLDVDGVTRPHRPLAITIRPYVEHVAPLRSRLQAMLADPAFQQSVQVRVLVLEGEAFYDQAFPTATDQRLKDDLLASRPDTDVLVSFVRQGGVRQALRDRPVAPATMAAITAALEEHFGAYADGQGLRFRSSSTVEDIEGFNGAGLYESFTGYLRAERLEGADREKTVERALKKTWASYWRAEAFEERGLARIDHLSGNMGVLVHASFQDEKELSNGVLFVTVLPPEHDDVARMELNAQKGALSVTNPDGTTELPEIDVVALGRDGAIRVERIRGSTLMPEGSFLYDDEALVAVFEEARAVAEHWLAVENAARLSVQAQRTVTIDMELREVDVGWPALGNGNAFPHRIVLKQARTVEPTVGRVSPAAQSQPLPRDVLVRARRIEHRVCASSTLRLSTVEAYTDPLLFPDLGYDEAPFTGYVTIDALEAIPALGLPAGARLSAVHVSMASQAHPSMAAGGPWDLVVEVRQELAAAAGFTRLEAGADGSVRLEAGGSVHEEGAGTLTCTTEVLHATPRDFLEGILSGP